MKKIFCLLGLLCALMLTAMPSAASELDGNGVWRKDVVVMDNFGHIVSDSVGRSLVTTMLDHYIIHRGAAFLASDTITVGSAANADFVLVNTTATEVHLKDFEFTSTEGDAVVLLYKGVTANEDGTLVPLNNKNFQSTATAVSTLRLNPTGVNIGAATQILHIGLVGGKKSGGTSESGNEEFVLKQNEKVLIRYTNNAVASDGVSYNMTILDVGAL